MKTAPGLHTRRQPQRPKFAGVISTIYHGAKNVSQEIPDWTPEGQRLLEECAARYLVQPDKISGRFNAGEARGEERRPAAHRSSRADLPLNHICTIPLNGDGIKLKTTLRSIEDEDGQNRTTADFQGGTREVISDFSRASRRRILGKIASIDLSKCGTPVFLTLTYPASFPTDGQITKAHLKAFLMAIRRKWPDCWGIWRLEFQARGAPHYHLLLWSGPALRRSVYAWLSTTWARIASGGDPDHIKAGTRLEKIESFRGVRAYVSKYIGKSTTPPTPEGFTNVGRFWAVFNAKKWPVKFACRVIPAAVFYKTRRMLLKFLNKSSSRKIKAIGEKGIRVFISSSGAERILKNAFMRVANSEEGAYIFNQWLLDALETPLREHSSLN